MSMSYRVVLLLPSSLSSASIVMACAGHTCDAHACEAISAHRHRLAPAWSTYPFSHSLQRACSGAFVMRLTASNPCCISRTRGSRQACTRPACIGMFTGMIMMCYLSRQFRQACTASQSLHAMQRSSPVGYRRSTCSPLKRGLIGPFSNG